ncbi:MAG: hypothetical protein J0I84_07120 [Terrimonas sp.]|nr:hypothetical protein [Terrimonas sp.]OJY93198.1 MAG: hypothetical protein BGP13_16285 [Sphingobacteriales bacterium 40-81]
MKSHMPCLKVFLKLLFFTKIVACNLAPGSYPYAETYELSYSEEEVKTAINKFKQEHPEYIVPKVTINNQGSWDLPDGQSKEPTHWYGVYFYYRNENKIIFTWTRPAGKNKTTFAFVSINDGLNLGNWKRINKDFSRSENKEEKKKFEERILNKIKEKL